MARKVFISYRAADRELARKVSEQVAQLGGEALASEWSARQGSTLTLKVDERLRASDLVIAIASKESAQSSWLNSELGVAVALNKKVVVITDGLPAKDLPPTLRSVRTIELRDAGPYLTEALQEIRPEGVAR
jgi:hypothetical protein